jgi:CRP/FNR family transcriptional regulator
MFETVLGDPVRNRTARRASPAPKAPLSIEPSFFLHQLHKGEHLFRSGDRKAYLYRVESGTVALTWTGPDGDIQPVETVEANQFFGLGYLDQHIYDACALSNAMVSCWPAESLAFVIDQFPDVRTRQDDAVEQEFAHRRATLTATPPATPAARLATFLSVVSRMNASEGRDPLVISETMRCPVVAGYLKVDIDTLGSALLELKRKNLIAAEPNGQLRILDLEGLEAYPDASRTKAGTPEHAF